MVDADLQQRAWAAASEVVDPELPVLTIADLGILRDVTVGPDGVEVTITPTYSGCPAMTLIALDIETALAAAGFGCARVRTVLAPAWSTEWMTEAGRRKLAAAGVAPPAARPARRALFTDEAVACPRCGATDTGRLSAFGSTACKALWRCRSCGEPFDQFKCH
jgi:ring-1,2-phenylacetyl-CoA epoxidase subunit PaaD